MLGPPRRSGGAGYASSSSLLSRVPGLRLTGPVDRLDRLASGIIRDVLSLPVRHRVSPERAGGG
ncbi:hypothetical protein ACIQZB_28735 [Streptomyces sp. NPDC097727]|uniref:hypothetical protein n=1 Tax=Streptomyces sp. NPDC097727 TaxID=3366092 RepID=UPI0037F767FD